MLIPAMQLVFAFILTLFSNNIMPWIPSTVEIQCNYNTLLLFMKTFDFNQPLPDPLNEWIIL